VVALACERGLIEKSETFYSLALESSAVCLDLAVRLYVLTVIKR
jgi:hypothetical protein